MKNKILLSLFLLLALTAASAANAPAAPAAPTAPTAIAAPDAAKVALTTRKLTLKQLGAPATYQLRTTEGSATLTFGSRADELVTRAILRVSYIYSPALLADLSHIKVMLNDEIVGVLPIAKDKSGRNQVAEIELEPRLFADFNRLKFQFVGHYSNECEDPLHSSLWADISGSSELEITARHLAERSDLALLPEPFFDQRDLRQLELPMVFGAHPDKLSLNAAGIAASWFGSLASWRGARFPTSLDHLPAGNAIVLAANDDRPAFLAARPPATAPGIEVIANPADDNAKLLVLTGRNGSDLVEAARALVLGNASISGSAMTIKKVTELQERQPYDAPNWVRVDRPTKFGELVRDPKNLQVFTHQPETIRIPIRVPPDLFTWHSRGVAVDLKYRYTPPIRLGESRLNMGINDELVQSFNLRPSGQGGDSTRLRLPLLDEGLNGEGKEVFIPAFKLGNRNELQFDFSFSYYKTGHCQDKQIENVRAMIDADSKVDFSGFPHYAEMPNLGFFATAGFPFTKYADLSQTVVVMPDKPSEPEIETMLALMGHMGESTGYPATQMQVAAAADSAKFVHADLLLIGALPRQPLLQQWSKSLPAEIGPDSRRLSLPRRGVSFLFDWLGFQTAPDSSVATQTDIAGTGPLGAILGFESPVSDERSVVAVTAVSAESLRSVLDALDNPGLVKSMHGSVVFIHADKVESYLVGKTYEIGELPFWTSIWFPLSEHPILLALMSVVSVLVFAFALWRTLKAKAARRMEEG